jgi:L-threonylcarbamoyladenylate synthase
MMPRVLSHDHRRILEEVDEALETGQTMIFPTETVYGIGGNPWDDRTLGEVQRLKGRAPNQPFTLHLPDVEAVARYARLDGRLRRVVRALLPGPYTLLLPARPEAPESAVANGVVGIRVPAHPFFSRVMAALDRPLFGTSVNSHGEAPLTEIETIIDRFGAVDLIVTGPTGGRASAIIDLTVVPPHAVRGVLPAELLTIDGDAID